MFKKLAPALLFAGVTMAYMASAGASNHQITICHATGNPGHYSMPNPTKQQIADDHGHRTGQQSVHPGDIIPPFAAGSHGGQSWAAFPGQNWDAEGQAIWNNGCAEVEVTTTTAPTTTTTEGTTTTTEGPTTTTTEAPTTTTEPDRPVTNPPKPKPPVNPPAPPVHVGNEVIPQAPPAPITELPRTGAALAWTAAAGLGALLLGMAAKRKSKRMLG